MARPAATSSATQRIGRWARTTPGSGQCIVANRREVPVAGGLESAGEVESDVVGRCERFGVPVAAVLWQQAVEEAEGGSIAPVPAVGAAGSGQWVGGQESGGSDLVAVTDRDASDRDESQDMRQAPGVSDMSGSTPSTRSRAALRSPRNAILPASSSTVSLCR